MPQLQIIAVGRLREKHWKDAAETYVKRLKRGYNIIETTIRDGDASLPALERSALEGERILQNLKSDCTAVCLDEHGVTMSSIQFARFVQQTVEMAKTPCFIIGGAYGLSPEVKKRAAKLLSFGPMTFPHELARVLLLEQLYRADAILHNRPYHHA